MDEFTVLLDGKKFDVVTVSETWLDRTMEGTLFAIDGFDLFRFDRQRTEANRSKKGGGLATYVNTECIIDPELYAYLNKCGENIEVQIMSKSIVTRNQ